MANQALSSEIREVAAPDGGIALELWAEGSRLARASASKPILEQMNAWLGLRPDQVAAELRGALVAFLTNQLATVAVSEPTEDPKQKLRFTSTFTLRSGDLIEPGVVWYDVTESTTGPDSLPAIVKNKMRHEVHRKLTDPGSVARELVGPAK